MRRLGVLGWPVAHSRSPAIHNAALAALGLDGWHYQRLPVPPVLLQQTTRALPGAGFVGANVTIPHKRAALALASQASRAAREIGAANTLSFATDGAITADNTDAPGLIAAMDVSPRGMTALVLGAGGSARAVVWALREAGASEVSVWNRTSRRAEELVGELGGRAVRKPVAADLLVNCTSVGLQGGLERSASHGETLNQVGMTFDQVGEYSYVVDLVYRSGTTPLVEAAKAHGARTLDGLELLVAQGALSLQLWIGRQPPIEVMRAAARGQDVPTG
jgi:shikimate dehydrogenase